MKLLERISKPADKAHRYPHQILIFKSTGLGTSPVFGVKRSYWPDDKLPLWFSTQAAIHAAIKENTLPL